MTNPPSPIANDEICFWNEQTIMGPHRSCFMSAKSGPGAKGGIAMLNGTLMVSDPKLNFKMAVPVMVSQFKNRNGGFSPIIATFVPN